jgi:3-oxoacyl-[acyl-carrier protein] reductase
METKKPVAVIVYSNHSIASECIRFLLDKNLTVVVWQDEKDNTPINKDTIEYISLSRFDFKSAVSFQDAAVELIQKFGSVDYLINNPRLFPVVKHQQVTNELWHETIDANLTVYLNAITVLAPFMQQQNFGRIINCCLPLRIHDSLTDRHYEGIREGVKGITQLWARELGAYGITVNTIIPGYVEEDNIEIATEKEIEQCRMKIPVKRFSKAIDVLNVYAFLLSKESNYINGSEIVVDGGVRI